MRSSRRISRIAAAGCGADRPYWSCTQALPGLSRVHILYCSGPRPSPSGGRPRTVRQTTERRSGGGYSVEQSATAPVCPRFTRWYVRPNYRYVRHSKRHTDLSARPTGQGPPASSMMIRRLREPRRAIQRHCSEVLSTVSLAGVPMDPCRQLPHASAFSILRCDKNLGHKAAHHTARTSMKDHHGPLDARQRTRPLYATLTYRV